ncbi:MAG TPA: hypothetical protein VJ739_14625, partial [Gemmataceae bacterium]|nr:hypothetical protein [Gemmataceae bacterium]
GAEGRSIEGRGAAWRFLLGAALAAGLLAGLAEGFLRLFPPRDLHPYLGEDSPLTGLFAPDADFGLRYRSWDDLRGDYAERLAAFGPLHPTSADPRPVWAFFGNSFFQAPGMLADTARASVPDRRIFNLARNELLEVRFAQVKMLLDNGLEPERIFIELMPTDLLRLGEQPLDSLHITARGAETYRPRLPGGAAGWVIGHSRLAFTAWCRGGWQHGNPHFNRRTLYSGVEPPLYADTARLFADLARVARGHDVPVTVLLIPSYHQVVEGASFGFQDQLGALFRSEGLDVLDPRDAFCRHPHPADLYLPDLHLTAAGNRLLLDAVLRHAHAPRPGPVARATRREP